MILFSIYSHFSSYISLVQEKYKNEDIFREKDLLSEFWYFIFLMIFLENKFIKENKKIDNHFYFYLIDSIEFFLNYFDIEFVPFNKESHQWNVD